MTTTPRPIAAASVQRGIVSDVAGAVLPDWVKQLVVDVPNQARSLAGTVSGRGQSTEQGALEKGASVAGKAQGGTDQAVDSAGRDVTAGTDQATRTAGTEEAAAGTHQQTAGAAAGALTSAAAPAATALNPVTPTIDAGKAGAIGTGIGGLPAGIPGGIKEFGSDVTKAVKDGVGADGKEGWDCDQSEVMAIAGGVGRAVTRAAVKAGKAVLGEARYAQLEAFVQGKIAGLQRTVAGIKKGAQAVVDGIKAFWDKKIEPTMRKLRAAMEQARKLYERAEKFIKGQVDSLLKSASQAWDQVNQTMIQPFLTWVQSKKKWVDDAVQGAIARLGSWWNKLPGAVKSGLLGAAAIVLGPIGLAIAAATRAAQALIAKKDKIIAWARAKADAAVSKFGTMYQKVRAKVEAAIKKVQEWGRAALEKAKAAGRVIAGAIEKNTPPWVTKLKAAAAQLKQRISGAVCTTLGDTAGPCVDQFVPDVGANAPAGASHDVSVAATGSLAAVVEGVPVKVAGGGSLTLSRVGKKYKVGLSGDGSVAVTTPAEGGESGASVTLPASVGGAKAAWPAITGKAAPAPTSPASPGPAPTGGTSGPSPTAGGPTPSSNPPSSSGPAPAGPAKGAAPAGGPAPAGPAAAPGAPGGSATKTETSAEAGVKAKIDMTYEFDGEKPGADKTCDGVGGMVAMLGTMGVSHMLPPPFAGMAGGGGSFEDHLTGCSVTLSEYGNAKVDVKREGVGGIQAAISGEAGVTVGREKTEAGMVDTATVFGTLGGSLGFELIGRADPPLKIGATGGLSGRLQASLSYNEALDKISAMSVGGSVTASLGSISLPKAQDVLPEPIASAVAAALEPYRRLTEGTIEAQASLSFENLHELLAKIDTYVNTNGGGSSAQGIIDIVAGHFAAEGNVKTSLTVVLKTTKLLAAAEVKVAGDGASGSAGITITENQTIPLYPVGAPGPGGSTPAPEIQAREVGMHRRQVQRLRGGSGSAVPGPGGRELGLHLLLRGRRLQRRAERRQQQGSAWLQQAALQLQHQVQPEVTAILAHRATFRGCDGGG